MFLKGMKPLTNPPPYIESCQTRIICRATAVALILAVAGLHVCYLACHSPLDLAPDEAHYWDWSRHLDWSYYSKGPLVAYLIRAGTEIAGAWSKQLLGSEMLAVRLPAIVCGSLLLASLYVLALQVYGRERLALAVVATALTLPVVAVGSTLMTIDAPYICAWGWALVLGHRAVFRGSGWAWPALGLVVGIGILAKYTMVLWPISLCLFLLADRSRRHLLVGRGFWLMAGTTAVCSLPIVLWNSQHDWVTFRHVGGQAGLIQNSGVFRWWGPFSFIGVQCGVLLGFWFIAWLNAMYSQNPRRQDDAGVSYLWWMSAPMFGVFLLFSVKTHVEPNWPVTAYLSGSVLTAAWVVRQLESPTGWRRRLVLCSGTVACALGLSVTFVMHYGGSVRPILAQVSGPASSQRPMPLRRFDPTCRLRGWRTLAAAVDGLRAELGAEGIEPVLAGTTWTLPGELGFYCEGHPEVFSLGSALGDRCSQYDVWRPNPVGDPDPFLGRTFIVIGEVGPGLRRAFDRLEPSRCLTYCEDDRPVAGWKVTVCRGFRGFTRKSEKSASRY